MHFRCLLILIFSYSAAYSSSAHAFNRCDDIFPDEVTAVEIQEMIDLSREAVREKTFHVTYQTFFSRVLNQSMAVYESQTPRENLNYLTLFSQWRLLPPKEWSNSFLEILGQQIDQWSKRHFLAFALQRKLTPLVLPPTLLTIYHRRLREVFETLPPNTQLETFSAELYHLSENGSSGETSWSPDDFTFLINALTESLKNTPKSLPLKSIKETYRGLLFLPVAVRMALADPITQLTEQLEIKLQDYNLSLAQGGRSGDDSLRPIPNDFRYRSLVMDLHLLYEDSEFLTEFIDPQQPGFFDPVDLLIVRPRLVVEWDGWHHYYRFLLFDGSLLQGPADLVLRPADQSRDRVLRAQSYRILRISPPLARQFDDINIEELIRTQNP